jgi:tetratricopeptide (TPR) repeat protein
MFDRALFARDFKEAERLTALAKSKNLDKLNGLIFEMQLYAEQMKLDEAIAAAKKATELDSLNPAAWRMLGRLLIARDQDRVGPDGKKIISTAGIDALQRAIQIKPDDAQAVTFLIQALENAGRPVEALAIAREKQKLVSGDINFQNAWLSLEYRHGDKEKSIDLRDRIFSVNPSNLANSIELAKHRVETKSYDKAALIINKLRTLDLPAADTAPLTALEAAMLAGKGDNAGAMRVFNELRTKIGETKGVEGELHVVIARLVADLGNFKLARDILADGKAIENKRKMPVSREQGDLAFRVGDWAEACKAYANVRASSTPEDDADGRLARRYSEALIRNNQPAEAESVISELIAQNKGKPDPQLLMLSAEVLGQQNKVKEALERLDQAIAAEATNPLAWYRRAQIRSTQPGMQDQAIADLEQVLKINPKFSGARVPLAIGYLQQSRYDKAVSVIRDGLTLEPQNSELRANLIRMMVQNERPDDALTELAEAKKVSEDLSWWYMSGEIYSQRGAFRPAADEFKYVWDRRKVPQNAAAYAQALMAIVPPQIPTAMDVLKSPELDVDKNVGLLLLRAYVNLQNKKPVDARVDVSKGMALLNKDDPGMVNDFFVELKKIYKPDELVTLMRDLTPPGGFPESVLIQVAAVKTAVPALRTEGLSEIDRLCDAKTTVIAAAACRLRADLHYSGAEYDQAIIRWKRALELEPNNPEALNNLAYTLSKYKGKPQEGLEMSKKAVELMPSNANVVDTLGQIYLALGNYADAEQYLNKALSLARDARSQAAPLIHLIETKIRKGDRPSADKSYQELQKLMEKARDNAPRLPDGSRAPTWVDTYKTEIEAVAKLLEAKG